jgi:putative oxidoreductase
MRVLESLTPVSLLALRLALGVVFFYHGYEKLVEGPADVRAAFAPLGLPPYSFYVLGTVELFGGIMLLAGLMTRVAALLLAIEMGVVLARVSVPNGGIYAVHNYELPLILCGGALALVATGAGLLSIDAATFERSGKRRLKPAG